MQNYNIPYNKNFEDLAKHIEENYKDGELIDFKTEIRNHTIEHNHDLRDHLISEERKKYWKFLAKDIILRHSTILNRH